MFFNFSIPALGYTAATNGSSIHGSAANSVADRRSSGKTHDAKLGSFIFIN
jgi:hypothetical protein